MNMYVVCTNKSSSCTINAMKVCIHSFCYFTRNLDNRSNNMLFGKEIIARGLFFIKKLLFLLNICGKTKKDNISINPLRFVRFI